MEDEKIALEIRTLNNLIKRYLDFSSHKKEVETITGNNGWIIGFLNEKADKGEDTFQKDIEDYFNLTRSTVSNVLSLMEQKELIQRLPVEQDARLKKIVLTEKARKIGNLMKEDLERMENALTNGFTAEELNTLSAFIRRMNNNLSNVKPSCCSTRKQL